MIRLLENMPAIDSRSTSYNTILDGSQDGLANSYLASSSSRAPYISASQEHGDLDTGLPLSYSNMQSLGHSDDIAKLGGYGMNSSLGTSMEPSLSGSAPQTYHPQSSHLEHLSNNTLLLDPSAGLGLSPSTASNIDHYSADGYCSDPVYSDYSLQTTPNIDAQLLETQMTTFNLNDTSLTSYQMQSESLGLESNFSTNFPALNGTLHGNMQLISPSLTSTSSPIMDGEAYKGLTNNHAHISSASNENHSAITYASIPSQAHRYSPALSNRSTAPSGQKRPTYLVSPIVRVETYSGDESTKSEVSVDQHRRKGSSHVSSSFLSPSAAQEYSDEESRFEDRTSHVTISKSPERNEDGSWVVTGTGGHGGVGPGDRKAMEGLTIPTLEEQEQSRFKAERDAGVQEWLIHSEVGSETTEAYASSANRRKHSANRRRAKSANDAHGPPSMQSLGLSVQTEFVDDSNIPGPGIFIDEQSELDEDEGSNYYDFDDESLYPDSPPRAMEPWKDNDAPGDTAYVGPISQPVILSRPWNDPPISIEISEGPVQPPTSNAAMVRFKQQSKDVDNASLAATIGSRRLSESDLPSLLPPHVANALRAARGVPDSGKQKVKEKRERRPSFLGNILPKRSNSNLLKRKGSHSQPQSNLLEASHPLPKETSNIIEKPKRMGSWGRPKSPKLDTSSTTLSNKDLAPISAVNPSTPSGPWAQAKNAIKRSRSRSDIGRSPGLAELMTQHGGPPMLTLPSQPPSDVEVTKKQSASHLALAANDIDDPDGDDDVLFVQGPVIMDLKIRSDSILPTYEGFRTHAKQLNPRLVDYMVERITQEQMRRYKRLLEFKVKHLNAVANKNCPSGKFCTALGGEPKSLPPKAGSKDCEAPFIGFQITAPGSSDEDIEAINEGTIVAAQFPPGVPLPPVKLLPAEFECPLCFKVKKFFKPSDWTKHVHEDVQPFTCTFPNCGEPKSFKRKADWVRHENERHRQLENWTCNLVDCTHTCFRKDNFVQHLVREHKIPEPRARTGRTGHQGAKESGNQPENSISWQGGHAGGGGGASVRDPSDDVWALVEECRHDTTKQPKDESCRFCGNICNSWKKLTVHLAKHMEQISMPILPLVEAKQLSPDTIISPVTELPQYQIGQSASLSKSPIENPSQYNPNASAMMLSTEFDANFSRFASSLSPSPLAAQTMHTYPPPQLHYQNQQVPQSLGPNYTDHSSPHSYNIRSYPGLVTPASQPGQYAHGMQLPSQSLHTSQKGAGRFGPPITPISAYGHQPMFSSPVDTSFSNPFTSSVPGGQQSLATDPEYNSAMPRSYPQPNYLAEPSYMDQQTKDFTYLSQ